MNTHKIIQGDCIAGMRTMPDGSVHTCITSPPYFGLFAFNCGSPSQDLGVMQQADHVIIANSSFSWWGAWLNRSVSKIVIAPSIWFGPRGPKKWSDVYAEGWVTI